MVRSRNQYSVKRPAKQGRGEDRARRSRCRGEAGRGEAAAAPKPNKIGASTPYNFSGKNLTPYGGLLPVAAMLEKLGFRPLVEQMLTVNRRGARLTRRGRVAYADLVKERGALLLHTRSSVEVHSS